MITKGKVVVTDDVDNLEINADGSINAVIISSALPSGASTYAAQTDKSQFTKLTDGTDNATITAAGELNVLSTAQPGIDLGDVTVNNAAGASAINIQDGGNSITVDGTVTVVQPTAANLNAQVVGNIASNAADSGNPVKNGAVYNSTLPTITSGNRVDNQADNSGRLIVTNIPLHGIKQTYSAVATNFGVANNPTDIFTITGSATKTIKITSILISVIRQTGGYADFLLIKRSTDNSGGTSTTLTNVSHDSNNASATATIQSYTANPTLGTTVGTVRSIKRFVDSGNSTFDNINFDFNNDSNQPIVLRGTSQVLAINLNAVTMNGNSFSISVEWVEE